MSSLLREVGIICAPTMRSRAYVQALAAAGLRVSRCFLMPGDEPVWQGAPLVSVDLRGDGRLTQFAPGRPIRDGLGNTPIVALPSKDINSDEALAELGRWPESVLIYSGLGGALVRAGAFALKKRFLHVHGGYVPDYRGSTAFYFSILKEGVLGASAIWLDEGIDTGPLLARRRYPIVPGLDVDLLADPLNRADLLVEVLSARRERGAFPDVVPEERQGTTFHVIHPVLKHLALRRCGLSLDGSNAH